MIPPRHAVIDASVVIRLLVQGPYSQKASRLFSLLATEPAARFEIPDLLYLECASALLKYIRAGLLSVDGAKGLLGHLQSLPLHSTPSSDYMFQILELSSILGISAYDATYVALEEQTGFPLVTADEKLIDKLAGAGHQVIWLGDLD